MGNNNSGHVTTSQAPPPWTQSLPRDAHRHKKHGAIQGPKVLPERIPGQRLKPTENGRNLQIQGTISPRKVSEVAYPPPGYPPPPSLNHHHSSMTALNHPSPLSPSSFYPSSQNDPSLINRFGPAPSKSFTSEPDLRGTSPTSHVSLPTPTNTPHTLISESPTKGKIKSKKRYKAPPPPNPLQQSFSFPLERSDYVPSPCMSYENRSSVSSPTSKSSKSKPKKMGLFRKRNESRMSNYEMESSQKESRVEGRGRDKERSTTPVPIQISSKKELKERARSLDNLQHEIKRTSQGLTNSLHSLEIIGNDEIDGQWDQMPYDNQKYNNLPDEKKHIDKVSRIDIKNVHDNPVDTTLERQARNHRRLSTVERKLYERQLVERRSEGILSSPVGDPKRFDNLDGKPSDQRRSYSSCSSYVDNYQKEEKDEWDLAEEEWLNKKKKSENLQKEIVHVVKNLRKTSVSPEPISRSVSDKKDLVTITPFTQRNNVEHHFDVDETPKTFFFGMNPVDESKETDVAMPMKTALSKLNDQDEVKIIGTAVEYSRHSLKPKEKRRSIERDSWNRSLDYRDKTRSRSRDTGLDEASKLDGKKRISREVDEFAATIERQKIKHRPSDELTNSISRKGDGGYHSRQNSGSFHLENEGSDDDNMIRMNLRPTLPRRQLELPRFSPNAAWRSLSVETSGKQKEIHNDIPLNDDVFSISEDQIHRYTRPTAPPRTSGEKSADSGISGDAGSPGPMQEFEPLTTDKVKSTSGPLAASSPVPARLEIKRTWTPAQDLDDNSFEEHQEHNGKGALQQISTLPKLTSRTNMFSKPEEDRYKRYCEEDPPYKEILPPPLNYRNEDFPTDVRSLQRIKRASSSKPNDVEDFQDVNNDDHWRENWSMSRSIPNSLNACDEPDGVENAHAPCRSKSESRVSLNQYPEGKGSPSKAVTPGYLQRGNSGHIMYLPEYKAYQLNKERMDRRIDEHAKHSSSVSKGSSTPDQERKSPSGDENPEDPESSHWNTERIRDHSDPDVMSKGKRFIVLNGKKNKKFSYQSTVRMMEKKKLEDKISKEVEEKERRRLQEVEAMMKVEQEFQLKREREKKRLKKQLHLFQQEEAGHVTDIKKASPDTFVVPEPLSKEAHGVASYDNQNRIGKYDDDLMDMESRHHVPPLPSSPPPFPGHRQMSSYQSLPMELVNNSGYPSTPVHQSNQSGLLSGFKKWVKGKKESRSGYLSDASSVTVNSGSPRQEPDGAPAPSPSRKNVDNIRAEMIAASRHRNGTTILDREMGSSRYGSGSPAPSVVSKESLLRTITPESKRTISPDSRRSASSEACRLTQELPEMRQELRQYREYRRSSRKAIMPYMGISPMPGHIRPGHKASQVAHNYRRDFCLGNVPQMKLHPNDDLDLYSRHSNESRKLSKHNKRSLSTEPDVLGGHMSNSSLRKQYSSSKGASQQHSVPIPIPPHHDPRSINHSGPLHHDPRSINHSGPPNHDPRSINHSGPPHHDPRSVNHSGPPHHHDPRSVNPSGIRIVGAHMHKYPPPHIAPYNPNKGYRPVNFSPTQGKILSVT